MDWKLDAESMKRIEEGEINFYEIIDVDLADARTNVPIDVMGDFFMVEAITGAATVRFNHVSNPALNLQKVRKSNTPFLNAYITNAAQAGKTLTILIGRDAGFDADPLLNLTGLVDLDGNDIAPAKEYTEGNPYVLKKLITAAGTPEDVDIYTALGVNAHHGYIKALSTNTGEVKIKYSYDGSTFTTNYQDDIQAGDVVDIDGMDIDTLRIDTAVSGEGVIMVVW